MDNQILIEDAVYGSIWNCYRFSFKIMLQCSTRFILERGRDGIVFDEKMEDGHVVSQNATHSP